MDDKELRLECLKIAERNCIKLDGTQLPLIDYAEDIYYFITKNVKIENKS
jgi:hypothetical protein